MIVYQHIIDGHTIERESDIINIARQTYFGDIETMPAEIKHKRYIDTVDGIGIWYDFGGDYYFFSDEEA